MSARNTAILKFSSKWFWDSWIFVYCRFDSFFTFIAKEKLHFSSICTFHCCLVKGGWSLKVGWQFAMRGIVAYKLVAYKKTKCSKSIPGFSISRLANVEDFFNVNIFFKCKYVRINDYSFKYVCVVSCLKFFFIASPFLQSRIWIQLISQNQTVLEDFNS